MTFTEVEAREFVTDARRAFAELIADDLYLLEGSLAACMEGPIRIPGPRSPLADEWSAVKATLGRYAHLFTVDGQRMFTVDGRDSLDAYLTRRDPGSVNLNDALVSLCADLAAVRDLRGRRGAILRDGVDSPRTVAGSEVEAIALTGPISDAVAELVGLHLDESSSVNEDDGRSWSSMSLEEQESIIGLVPDETVDASTLRGRWDQYSALIADLEARRDAEVVGVLAQSSLRLVAKDLGVSHTMVAKIAARGARRVLTVCG